MENLKINDTQKHKVNFRLDFICQTMRQFVKITHTREWNISKEHKSEPWESICLIKTTLCLTLCLTNALCENVQETLLEKLAKMFKKKKSWCRQVAGVASLKTKCQRRIFFWTIDGCDRDLSNTSVFRCASRSFYWFVHNF